MSSARSAVGVLAEFEVDADAEGAAVGVGAVAAGDLEVVAQVFHEAGDFVGFAGEPDLDRHWSASFGVSVGVE